MNMTSEEYDIFVVDGKKINEEVNKKWVLLLTITLNNGELGGCIVGN